MGFFSDGENDTKTEMVWKENILSVFGEKMRFSSLSALMLSGLVLIGLQSFIYTVVD